MKIFLTCPSFVPHGGIRIILEWANRLSRLGHKIVLYNHSPHIKTPRWFTLDKEITITSIYHKMSDCDCLIITSPHTIDFQDISCTPRKVFLFMQMMEDLFRPRDRQWKKQCMDFYLSPHPMFSISEWNINSIMGLGRRAPTYYIGNGVNLDDFPIENPIKDGKTILVEGWVPGNPSKDHNRIAPKVARKLKSQGYYILAYSQLSLDPEYADAVDEYYRLPKLSKMNDLYRRASILIKASVCDARACAPMEAMTKGTVTVRAIENGDDDLIHGYNAVRCNYNESSLYRSCKGILQNRELLAELSLNCLQYVQEFDWKYWMKQIEEKLCVD